MADFGAYSPDQVYTSQIVSELLDYGIARGVRVLPEVDGPSHVGAGWLVPNRGHLGRFMIGSTSRRPTEGLV